MPEGTINLLLSGVGGAVVGTVTGALITAWLNFRKDRYHVDITAQLVSMRNELVNTKEQFLYQLKDSFKEAQESVTLVRQTLKEAKTEGGNIEKVREQAENIVKGLTDKTGIDAKALATILQPDVLSILSAEIDRKFDEAASQRRDLTKLLVESIAPRWEIAMLYRIAGEAPYMHNTSKPSKEQKDFRDHLGQLWGRGFIQQSQDKFLPWNQGEKNVKDWYEVSPLGKQLIALRKDLGLDAPRD